MLSISELKSSTSQELIKELAKAMKKLQELRIGVKTSHLKDTSAIKKQKRYIAQMFTFLKEIELDEKVKQVTQISLT